MTNKEYLLDTVSQEFKDNSKKFWDFVKIKGQDACVAPLKNKDGVSTQPEQTF